MDNKLKYLKSFENYQMINEEEEGWKEWMLAGLMTVSSLFGGDKAMGQQTYGIDGGPTKTEIVKTGKNVFRAKVLMGTTSSEKCYNDVLLKFGLKTEGNNRLFKGKVGDLMPSILKKDSTMILSGFKPVNQNEVGLTNFGNLTDVFIINGEKIVDSGKLTFDLSNPNTEIVASGNGLLALTRIVRQAFGSGDIKLYATVEFNVPRESKAIDISFSYSKEGLYKKTFMAFETAITESSKFVGEETYAHHTGVDTIIGATLEQSVEFIYGLLVSGTNDFIPKSLYGDVKDLPQYLSDNGYELPSKDKIKEYLTKFKDSGKVDADSIVEFNMYVQDLYNKNLEKFANLNLGKEGASKLVRMVKSNTSGQYKLWKTKISGGEDETIAHAWNSLKSVGKTTRTIDTKTETDQKTYRIGENKKYRKFK